MGYLNEEPLKPLVESSKINSEIWRESKVDGVMLTVIATC